ncbi:GNAT family N-acetyltransferase [Thermococcus sp. MV5]|uniref:GNAT family N-acetyltransferase n=1 Tax=Thermococcus sp. MV5 TaxID=1638272 RepID=UPI00143BBD89|nr:GNAT family N-acetyltransferase [Thermococcus sp. MV5]NJE25696.1 GNAT family N-acetyltransferase [Thermococcus sp. MV5]
MRIEIREVDEANIDEMISVCNPSTVSEAYKKGVEIKRTWLLEMLRTYGDVGFVAYFNEKPAAQLLTYPEKADPTSLKRENVLVVNCVYNPLSEAQRKGIARKMVETLIEKAKGKYEFLVTHAFDTGEFLSQAEFFRRMGFREITKEDLYYSFSGRKLKEPYSGFWKDGEEYKRSNEDIGKVLIFYEPTCPFTYLWAYRAKEIVKEIAPELEIRMLNGWEHPEEFVSRGRNWMLVNGIPIKSLPIDRDRFREEIKNAMGT